MTSCAYFMLSGESKLADGCLASDKFAFIENYAPMSRRPGSFALRRARGATQWSYSSWILYARRS
jgi:hypothetical protein